MLDTDQLNFAKAYLVKNGFITDDTQDWKSKDFDKFIDEMDKADYKRMMTAYRVAKKRKNDKDAGTDLVTITITQKSHAILKALAKNNSVTLSHVIERTGLRHDVMLNQDLESLKSECEGYKYQIEELKHQLSQQQAERDAATITKQEPEQTWAFSYEDLQEQAKLLEKLQEENARLKAELKMKERENNKPKEAIKKR